MSALLVWVLFPGFVAAILFLFRHDRFPTALIGSGVAFLLGWVAWQVPIGEVISLGPIAIKISETMSVLGRDFSFTNLERPLLAFLYLATALWLLGSYFADPGELFVPAALAIVSLLIAALAVEPFLFAALLIEIAVLLSIPLLAPPRKPAGPGLFRYLAFQTFGMPFILFTGWMLAGVGASPGDLELVVLAGALLAMGFAFLLAVFPFHTWIPMLASEVHPYIIGFLFFTLPTVISMFALGFLDRYSWLRESESVYILFRGVGIVMVVVGGLWAAFQNHLGKIFGYAAIMEIGLSLAAIGLGSREGIPLYFALFLPRLISYLVWATALSFIYRISLEDLTFSSVQGLGLQYPYMVVGLLAAQFSLAGIPLFAGFPVRIALWSELAQVSPVLVIGALFGNFALLAGGLRTLMVLMKTDEKNRIPVDIDVGGNAFPTSESIPMYSILLFSLASGLLLLVGLLPQWFLPTFTSLSQMFEHLGS
jgi:formate hydrogenlyase subunit 3/multisubunit Na+/H+ antiporter MnhD subunit